MSRGNNSDYHPKQQQKGMMSLAITSTSNGHQAIFSVNDEIGDVKKVAEGCDERNFYKHISFVEGSDQMLICISHTNEGCFLRLLRYISGRSGDNQEAWIYIPANLELPAEKLDDVIAVVRDAIKDTNLTDHAEILQNKFQEEYPVRTIFPIVKLSTKGRFAYRRISKAEGLKGLLGDKLFEPYYYDYEKVLFVNSEDVSVKDVFDNISNEEFSKWIVVSKDQKFADVDIRIDGKEIGCGLMVDGNQKHDVEYENKKIPKLEIIRDNGIRFDSDTSLPGEKKLDFMFELKRSCFTFIDSDTDKEISDPVCIKVGKQEFGEGLEVNSLLVSYDRMCDGGVPISFSRTNYETKTDKLKCIPLDRYKVVLNPKKYEYTFRCKSVYCPEEKLDIEFKLKLDGAPKSPIRGYYISKESSAYNMVLRRRWFYKKPLVLITVVSILLLCVGFMLGMYVFKYIDGIDNAKNKGFVQPETTIKTQVDTSFQEFVDIIDANILNGNIKQEELDSIGYGRFYADLNNYNFNALTNEWTQMLMSNSKNWKNFIEIVNVLTSGIFLL